MVAADAVSTGRRGGGRCGPAQRDASPVGSLGVPVTPGEPTDRGSSRSWAWRPEYARAGWGHGRAPWGALGALTRAANAGRGAVWQDWPLLFAVDLSKTTHSSFLHDLYNMSTSSILKIL